MSKTVVINRFDGGIAEDLRTHATNECADSTNFDIFSNPHKLIHLRDMIREPDGSETVNNRKISDVGVTQITGTEYTVAFGINYPTNTAPAAYKRSNTDLNAGSSGFSLQEVGTGTYVHGSYFQYNNVAYCLGINGSTTTLFSYTGAGSLTAIDTVTYALPYGGSYPSIPKPFVHPTDNRVYIVVGNSLSQWNGGGSFTDYNSLLPSGYYATGISNYGDYLAISMTPYSVTGESIICLWDRDPSHDTYLSNILKCGNEKIDALANLNGDLVVVTSPSSAIIVDSQKIRLKVYQGGQIETIKTLHNVKVNGSTTYSNTRIISAIKNNRLYFVRYGDIALWSVGKNTSGAYVMTHDYNVYKGSTSTSDKISEIKGISFIGDCLYVGAIMFDNTFRLLETSFGGTDGSVGSGSVTWINPAVYTTTINPSMSIGDRDELKRLVSVQVLFDKYSNSNNSGSNDYGTCTLEYAVDGSTVFTTIDAHDMSDGNHIIEATTQNGIPFATSREFQFRITSTWGANIIGIRYKYETLNQLV